MFSGVSLNNCRVSLISRRKSHEVGTQKTVPTRLPWVLESVYPCSAISLDFFFLQPSIMLASRTSQFELFIAVSPHLYISVTSITALVVEKLLGATSGFFCGVGD